MKNSSLSKIIGISCDFKLVEGMKRNKETREKHPVNDFMIRQDQQMLDELTQEMAKEMLANGWGFSEIADFIEKLRNADYDRENEDALVAEIKKWVNEAEQMAAA